MIYTERIINHRYMIYILTKSTSWRSCVYNLQHHSYNSIIVKLESRPLISLILYHGWILNMKEFCFLVKNIKGIEKIWNRTSHALQLPFNSCTNQQACLPVHTYIHDQILHSATDDDADTHQHHTSWTKQIIWRKVIHWKHIHYRYKTYFSLWVWGKHINNIENTTR